MTLSELAQQIKAELRGNGHVEITGANSLENANFGDVTFAADTARLNQARDCEASGLIVPAKLAERSSDRQPQPAHRR